MEDQKTSDTDKDVEDIKKYLEKYRNHRLRFEWESSDSIDSESDIVDIEMFTKDGNQYHADFATPKYINWIFETEPLT